MTVGETRAATIECRSLLNGSPDATRPPRRRLRDDRECGGLHLADFATVYAEHRGEIFSHCYRMTGSAIDAEDLCQDVFAKALLAAGTFEGRASARTWLYRIATNACIDFLRNHERRSQPASSVLDILERADWLSPCPDAADPADRVAQRETTDLYVAAALSQLPERQRAALVARDMLELSASETAHLLQSTPAAVNSLLQRGRARLRALGVERLSELAQTRTSQDDELVRSYVRAHDAGDIDSIMSLLAEDVRISMPPEEPVRGRAQARGLFVTLLGSDGHPEWRLVPGQANGAPAVLTSVRSSENERFQANSVDVFRIQNGTVVAMHCFLGRRHLELFETRDA